MDSELMHSEKMFLRGLGLHAKPNPVSPPPVPAIMWKLYEQRMGRTSPKKKQDLCFVEEFNVPGSIIRNFNDQGQFVPQSSRIPSNLCFEKRLFFNISVMESAEKVTMGRLELKFTQNSYYGRTFELRLYRILRMSLRGMDRQKASRKLLSAQTFSLLRKSLYINLTEVCQIWRNPHKNLGLALEILHRKEGTLDECQSIQTFLHTSLLTVSLNPLHCTKQRQKRSSNRFPFMPSSFCQRRRRYVDFRDLGWKNLVVAPRGYFANDCSGECPYPLTEILNSTNHAVLQTLVHSYEPEDVPPPCCIPTKLSPLSVLLYDDDGNIVLRHYDNMTVDECGCR
ncbi:protein DVR-1-like [Leptodactylus fuscus]